MEAFQQAFTPVLQAVDDDFLNFSEVDSNFDRTIDLTVFNHSGYDGADGGIDCETGAISRNNGLRVSHAQENADYPTNHGCSSAAGYDLGAYAVSVLFSLLIRSIIVLQTFFNCVYVYVYVYVCVYRTICMCMCMCICIYVNSI